MQILESPSFSQVRSVKMAVFTPEEIVEIADRLMKDIADSTKDIASEKAADVTMAANYAIDVPN
jgi:hypothetical protein